MRCEHDENSCSACQEVRITYLLARGHLLETMLRRFVAHVSETPDEQAKLSAQAAHWNELQKLTDEAAALLER